jgi:hypothetical protein
LASTEWKRERWYFGGQVYIDGIAGKGTTVKVEIPVDEIKDAG